MSAITDYTVHESIESNVHIETYRASGIDSSPEAREEAFQIANSLGLTEQSKAYSSQDHMLEWPVASRDLVGLYCVCFPKNTPLKDYKEPVPMAVLREVEKVRKICDDPTSDYKLSSLIVLSPSVAASPDPVLFACIHRKGESSWNAKPYLIARWGSALLPIEDLYEIAKQRVVDALIAKKAAIDAEISIVQQASKPVFSHTISDWNLEISTVNRHDSVLSM